MFDGYQIKLISNRVDLGIWAEIEDLRKELQAVLENSSFDNESTTLCVHVRFCDFMIDQFLVFKKERQRMHGSICKAAQSLFQHSLSHCKRS